MTRIEPHELYPPGGGAPVRHLIDVRAPVEVARGQLPGSTNLPILTDEERHEVGLRYAEAGGEAAYALGEAITADAMPERVRAWRAVCDAAPAAFLCWRGGQRSELAQRLTDRPDAPRVTGGYKAVRAHLTASLESSLARRRPLVVTGPTGSGKTELLTEVASLPDLLALDLEGAAEHRGSTFGARGPQPPQATFEHRLALPLLLGHEGWLLLEDESRNVGRVHLPEAVFERVRSAPLLVLEDALPARVDRIHREYVAEPARARGEAAALDDLREGVRRLRRRLGGRTVDQLVERLEDAHRVGAWFEPRAFFDVIGTLLRDYYDPLYRKATPLAARDVRARGGREELMAWLRQATQPSPA